MRSALRRQPLIVKGNFPFCDRDKNAVYPPCTHIAPVDRFRVRDHSAYKVRRLRISLPLIEPLIDGVRYFRPGDAPALSGEDLRASSRPKLHKIARPVTPARPSGQLNQTRDLAELADAHGLK